MCTAVSFKSGDTYFGRNLDLERGYNECVVITPRNFELKLRCLEPMKNHYAMIGMAAVIDGFPLYFEATNEMGLSMAGLNFPQNAVYFEEAQGMDNVTPFEFIPWILGQCACIREVRQKLNSINLVNINFSQQLPLSPLHWMISDTESSIVVESVKDGLKIYDNPFEVLTNNPTFDYHRMNINNYMSLNNGAANNQFRAGIPLHNYSLGMGALGLPGDFSSASRFVRAFFVKENSALGESEEENVSQFFHIMNSVAMPKGCVWTPNGFEYTRYTSCCNANKGIYHYTTYDCMQIISVRMQDADLDDQQLYTYKIDN